MLSKDEINARFGCHPATGKQGVLREAVRGHAHRMASDLICDCPPGPELAEALTKLEECMMWADAAIVRRR